MIPPPSKNWEILELPRHLVLEADGMYSIRPRFGTLHANSGVDQGLAAAGRSIDKEVNTAQAVLEPKPLLLPDSSEGNQYHQ